GGKMTQLSFIKSDNNILTPAMLEVRQYLHYKIKLRYSYVNYLTKYIRHSGLWADKHAAPITCLKYCDVLPRCAIKPPNGQGPGNAIFSINSPI
ncbi:TPA: hypothetical protein ACGSEA_004650, partial [Yersinia enterocolitica]